MTLAIVNSNKYSDEKEFLKKEKRGVGKNKYVHREKTSARVKNALKTGLLYTSITLAIAFVISASGFVYFYSYYSAIVEKRIASGFWHNRAGIYAAPRTLQKNQKISKETVVELLRRSGYVEKDSPDLVWNGSFTADDDSVEIKTNNSFGTKAETATVKFSGNKIVSISDGTSNLENYEI